MNAVQLNRRFVPCGDHEPHDFQYELLHQASLDWPQLLERRRVILLAEAGSGKSVELAERARILVASGKLAFYATVQDVARVGLDDAIDVPLRDSLQTWKASEEPGWFFIDSVDEAKLDRIRLDTALRRLAGGLGQYLGRAHIVLSGRYTDWEFRADLKTFEAQLPVPPSRPKPVAPSLSAPTVTPELRARISKVEQTEDKPLVVVMAPLDAPRVRLFASQSGIAPPDRFMQAVEEANLWAFARRPLDLEWLVGYWVSHDRFGSLAEMLDASFRERLRERNPQHALGDEIEGDRAVRAMERVGAALVFGRTDKLEVPDSTITLKGALTSFNLGEILPDWSEDNRRRLLSRPVFDPSTFGRVRLHNDNDGAVRSYLAARWLLRRQEENCPARKILSLAFANTYGVALIKPSVRQTTAWLSIWNVDVANEVINRDPSLLLTAGDPKSLPLATRKRALDALINRLLNKERLPDVDRDSLRYVSTSDLSSHIRELWRVHAENADVRRLLLLMIWAGRLKDCEDIAEKAVFSSYMDRSTQIFGGQALLRIGSPSLLRRYADRIRKEAQSLPSAVIWDAIEVLFPSQISIDELAQILTTLSTKVRDEGYRFRYSGPSLVSRMVTSDDISRFLQALLEIPPERPKKIGTNRTQLEKDLAPIVAATSLKLLQQAPKTAVPPAVLAATFWLTEGMRYQSSYQSSANIEELLLNLEASADRRRIAFWFMAERLKGHYLLFGNPILSPHHIDMGSWRPKLDLEDCDWLLADSRQRSSNDDQALTINTLMDIWQRNGQPTDLLDRIKAAASLSTKMSETLSNWLAPPAKPPELLESERKLEELQKRQQAEQDEQDRSWRQFIDELKANPAQLRDLPAPTAKGVDKRLYYLWQLLQNATERQSRYAIDDLTPLEPRLGAELIIATRDAFVSFWRKWTPTLASSRPPDERNLTNVIDCIGLVGISLEAKGDTNWTVGLSKAEARLATAYATLELNGFPSWLPTLAASHPAEVREVLLAEVRSQLDAPETAHGILEDISSADTIVVRAMGDALLAEWEGRKTFPKRLLPYALHIIATGSEATRKAFLAKIIACVDQLDAAEELPHYLQAIFRIDASAATNVLARRLNSLDEVGQAQLVQRLLASGFDDSFSRRGLNTADLPFEILTQLVRTAFKNVRTIDDAEKRSGVYSPGERDHAESARNSLFAQLVRTPGRATYEAIRGLTRVKDFGVPVERLAELAIERAATDSENSAWQPGDCHNFELTFDTQPRTPLDLQLLTQARVEDLQHELIHGDFGQGLTLKRLPSEREVQRWVATQLHERRGQAYSVERESNVADEKEPDIRLRAKSSDASLPIEIKVAESWTLTELTDALCVQLASRYVRPIDAKHGILLLVHQHRRPKGWRGQQKMLKFHDVVEHLQTVAASICSTAPDSPQVAVAVVDVSTVAVP